MPLYRERLKLFNDTFAQRRYQIALSLVLEVYKKVIEAAAHPTTNIAFEELIKEDNNTQSVKQLS